ncbi:hypothetical protein LTR78_001239 [Recurvomyces mirabilis]|uniref:Fungal N-terminal domain-containing protein n=1 Tax=Recurvomyces mirabilis TaxID=574656 RepID=A0AAE0WWF9_9PEZI|nr:hypothetical protein LTR78_001239 [Recurvomyces mirabilis]KAK5161215.1 hypothetical protein LTS14_001011 [Recurvomyces mirabilis]
MDPVSILSLVGVCWTIAARAASIGTDIKTVKNLFKEGSNTTQEIDQLDAQVQTLDLTASRLADWLRHGTSQAISTDEAARLLESLRAYDMGTARIQAHILNVRNGAESVGFGGKVRHWWYENDLKKDQAVLSRQIQAMSFMVQTFCLPVTERAPLMLSGSECSEFLEQAREDVSSLGFVYGLSSASDLHGPVHEHERMDTAIPIPVRPGAWTRAPLKKNGTGKMPQKQQATGPRAPIHTPGEAYSYEQRLADSRLYQKRNGTFPIEPKVEKRIQALEHTVARLRT